MAMLLVQTMVIRSYNHGTDATVQKRNGQTNKTNGMECHGETRL